MSFCLSKLLLNYNIYSGKYTKCIQLDQFLCREHTSVTSAQIYLCVSVFCSTSYPELPPQIVFSITSLLFIII